LVKAGRPLAFELLYTSQSFDPYLTVYQEDLRKVGITVNLRLVTPETQFQMINERRFEMTLQGWGALRFPNPETSYHSRLADVNNTNNITGFKSARADELFKQYDTAFNVEDRVRIIREVDGILANEYHYAPWWYGPYVRILYWNKFGAPQGYVGRTADYIGAGNGPGVPQLWWVDPDKVAKFEQAMRDSSIKLEVGPTEDRYWLEYTEKENQNKAGSAKSD
jgi:microcin C transport system substrate-binding protein